MTYDPEDDYLPPWDEIKRGYPNWYLDRREKFIAERMMIVEQARRAKSRVNRYRRGTAFHAVFPSGWWR